MWVNALGWTATAIFAVSYFSKSSRSLRLIQASAAALWIVYGLAIHAAPVIDRRQSDRCCCGDLRDDPPRAGSKPWDRGRRLAPL